MIRKWEILKRELVSDFQILQVQKKKVRSPRTGAINDVLALQFPPWVLVVALTPDEEVVMIRQYRHGTEQVCLELPGGLVDPEDTSPVVSAQRELLEETGYQASKFHLTGECFPQPAILTNKCYFFAAEKAEQVQKPILDAGEDIDIIKVSVKSIPALIEKKEIDHGMVLLAFFYFWLMQGQIGGTRP
ncbi:MAG: NUDIX hydrolase [Deltaproteobacteria bacterium]|nr:MAG: NUDIX hydrolase [Deltaproteobacteria bacterium]